MCEAINTQKHLTLGLAQSKYLNKWLLLFIIILIILIIITTLLSAESWFTILTHLASCDVDEAFQRASEFSRFVLQVFSRPRRGDGGEPNSGFLQPKGRGGAFLNPALFNPGGGGRSVEHVAQRTLGLD